MALHEEETHLLQNPSSILDDLYCEEESFVEDISLNHHDSSLEIEKSDFSLVLHENDLIWEEHELLCLISKEKETNLCVISDGCFRKEAVDWIFRVISHYGFTPLTAVLALNYFDRFVLSPRFLRDKPWMTQLVAVACLSLAAKVEEIQPPLLLDLQVEESKFIFEAKTIQRMELLVLTTLGWRMNPVTPISFFDHIIRRLGLKTLIHWDFMWRCEHLLLSVVADARFMCYLPSILATAIMLHVIEEFEPCNKLEYQNQLMGVLKVNEEEVKRAYKLIQELSGEHNDGLKRKHRVMRGSSPDGVIDASFSSDSSNDSWASSSAEDRRFKRSRVQEQQMRLPSLNRMLSSPH